MNRLHLSCRCCARQTTRAASSVSQRFGSHCEPVTPLPCGKHRICLSRPGLVSGWRFAPPCCAGRSVCGLPPQPPWSPNMDRSRRRQVSQVGPSSSQHANHAVHAANAPAFTQVRSRSSAAPPNPSLKLTRYGMQRKPGVRRLRHLRTPGLHCTPPRAA